MNTLPKKGLFWLICSISCDGDVVLDKLISAAVEITQATPVHKEIWDSCKHGIRRPWNYYPRGRVEIRHSKAIVYANSLCYEVSDFPEKIRTAFHLGMMPLELKTDNSPHYTEGVFGYSRCVNEGNRRKK